MTRTCSDGGFFSGLPEPKTYQLLTSHPIPIVAFGSPFSPPSPHSLPLSLSLPCRHILLVKEDIRHGRQLLLGAPTALRDKRPVLGVGLLKPLPSKPLNYIVIGRPPPPESGVSQRVENLGGLLRSRYHASGADAFPPPVVEIYHAAGEANILDRLTRWSYGWIHRRKTDAALLNVVSISL